MEEMILIRNVDLAKRIVRKLKTLRTQDETYKFDMSDWICQVDLEDGDCGTAMCIGGWAVHFEDKEFARQWVVGDILNAAFFHDHAANLLGIKLDEAKRLFFVDEWPYVYRLMSYDNEIDAAIQYLEDLIKFSIAYKESEATEIELS